MARKRLVVLLAMTLGSALYWTPAQGFQDEDEPQFEYGLSCSLLADLDRSELIALIHVSQQPYFDYFCQAESVYNCSDYDDFLYQLAHLEKQDELMCRLVPHYLK